MENKPKKEARRSNAYPSITIKDALDLTDFIYRNSGHSYLKLEDVAKLTNKSTGGMSQKVGSAVQYNLLEMKSGVGYRPSDLFKKIMKPINDDEKQKNLLESFKSPKLYSELINRFDGSALPSELILPNILERDHNIYDDAAKKAAQIFLENIEYLGLKNTHNELVLSQSDFLKSASSEENQDYGNSSSLKSKANEKDIHITNSDLLKIEIALTNDKKAIIFYPTELTRFDIELIKLQISVFEKLVEFKQKPE